MNHNIDDEIIRSSFGDCLFLFYSDITNVKKIIRMMEDELKETWDKVYSSVGDWYKAVCILIDERVHPDDKDKVRDILDFDKYKEFMQNRKSHTIYFRYHVKPDDEYIYEKLSISKLVVDEDKSEILVFSSTNVDEEFKSKLQEMEAKKQQYSVTYALGREYSSIYYVEVESGKVTPYNLSNRIEGMFGDKFYKLDYDESVKTYIDLAVVEKDKEMMKKVLSRKFIMSRLATQDHFTWIYQNNEHSYCEMKCVKVSEKDEPFAVVMGFAVKDAEIRIEMEEKAQTDFQLSLLDGLSREYEMVWLLRDRKMRLFRVSDNPSVQSVALQYYDCQDVDLGFASFAERYVCEEDKERLREFTKYDNLIKEVPKEGMHSTIFKRQLPDDRYVYIQLCFTRAVGPDGVENIVCAVRDVDSLIREENARKEQYRAAIKERDLDGLTGIRNRYCYEHYIVNIEKNLPETLSVIYIDADFLHEINNTQGHDAGDEMIRFIADNCVKLWGLDNSFRIGGDEFVVFDYDTDKANVVERLDILKKKIKDKKYSVSIGFNFADKNMNLQELIAGSEKAMYEDKEKHHKEKGYLR